MDDDFFAAPTKSMDAPATNVFDEVLVANNAIPAAAHGDNVATTNVFDVVPQPAAVAADDTGRHVSAAAARAAATASPAAAVPAPSVTAQHHSNVSDLMKVIQERTAAIDKATREKEDRQKKAAQEYLAEENQKRAAKLKIIREDHRKEQADNEKKASELKKSGAVWASVGLLVDLKKANPHSKKTDRMKQVLSNLEKTNEAH